MIRTVLAALVALVGAAAWPLAAHAYPAPPAPEIVIEVAEDDIEPGDTVIFTFSGWLPGADVSVTVESPGVAGDDIGLEVLGSTSVVAEADANGEFQTAITFPEAGRYTITATGPNADGETTTVTLVIDVEADGSTVVQQSTGGGLPQTGFAGSTWMWAGAGLVALGGALAGGAALTRRRSTSDTPVS